MKNRSDKRAARDREASIVRKALITEVNMCEICGTSPRLPRHPIRERNQLCVHEIARGPLRNKAMDKRYATLVVCWGCNEVLNDRSIWPEPRQLRVLARSRPDDYDLAAYNRLVNENAPNRITEDEVRIGQWIT